MAALGARRRDAAARAGRRRQSSSKHRSISNGPSTGSSRCRSCWRGCSIRSAIGSSAAIAARSSLRVTLTLVTRELHERSVELPAPMRDARVLRTLALLDLESNPPPAAIDRVTVAVDVTEGRVLQFGLFARALPTDTLATLMARLGALMGSDRVGAPSLVDTYRPGAFAMAKFDPPRNFTNPQSPIPNPANRSSPSRVLRRFRSSDSRARHARTGTSRAGHHRPPRVQPAAASSAARDRGARPAIGGRTAGIATSGTCCGELTAPPIESPQAPSQTWFVDGLVGLTHELADWQICQIYQSANSESFHVCRIPCLVRVQFSRSGLSP